MQPAGKVLITVSELMNLLQTPLSASVKTDVTAGSCARWGSHPPGGGGGVQVLRRTDRFFGGYILVRTKMKINVYCFLLSYFS
jgi:hypothetical protein